MSERQNLPPLSLSLSCFFSGLFGPIFFSQPLPPLRVRGFAFDCQSIMLAVRYLSEVEGQPSSMHFTYSPRYKRRPSLHELEHGSRRKFFSSSDLGGIDLFSDIIHAQSPYRNTRLENLSIDIVGNFFLLISFFIRMKEGRKVWGIILILEFVAYY